MACYRDGEFGALIGMRVRHENRLTVGPVRFNPTFRGIADYICVASLKYYNLFYIDIIQYY